MLIRISERRFSPRGEPLGSIDFFDHADKHIGWNPFFPDCPDRRGIPYDVLASLEPGLQHYPPLPAAYRGRLPINLEAPPEEITSVLLYYFSRYFHARRPLEQPTDEFLVALRDQFVKHVRKLLPKRVKFKAIVASLPRHIDELLASDPEGCFRSAWQPEPPQIEEHEVTEPSLHLLILREMPSFSLAPDDEVPSLARDFAYLVRGPPPPLFTPSVL